MKSMIGKLLFLGDFFSSSKRKTRRIAIALLALLLFAACQPTPAEDVVMNKAEGPLSKGTVTQSVTVPRLKNDKPGSATDAPAQPTAPAFPDRWEEVQTVRGATVTWRATVETKTDGRYPLYRMREQPVDGVWRQRVLSVILSAPLSRESNGMTRTDWTRQFQGYVDRMERQRAWIEQGFPDWDDVDEGMRDLKALEAELQQVSKSYQAHIADAPERNETVSVTDYTDVPEGQTLFTLTGGEKVLVQTDRTGLMMTRWPTFLTEHPEDRHEERVPIMGPFDEKWQEVRMSRAEAEAALQKLLRELGLDDFTAARTYKANLMAGEHDRPASVQCVAPCWCFELMRSFGGCPVESNVYLEDRWIRHDGAGDYAAPLRQESLKIVLNEDGVWYFAWFHPKTVTGLEAEAAVLLPFEQAQRRIKNAFSACLDVDTMRAQVFQGEDPKLQVWRVLLTPFVVRLPNSEDLLALPCYLVFFDYDQDWRESTWTRSDAQFRVLVVSALDGSIIDPEAGY